MTPPRFTDAERIALTLRLPENRVQAHQIIFSNRHPQATPPFHTDLINLYYSAIKNVLIMAFRGAAKSTIAEEVIVLGGAWRLFNNALIISSNEARAHDRLRACKAEFTDNEYLLEIYGHLRGEVWNEGRIELSNGVCIQALGRGQDLLGIKHKQWRPDFLLCDDIEDEESVADPAARHAMLQWFYKKLLPAMDQPTYRARVCATPLDNESLPMTLMKLPNWEFRRYPVEAADETGCRLPLWPARYPLSWVDTTKAEYESAGMATEFQQEYMCVAEDPSKKLFTADLIRVRARVRTIEPVYLVYDPARTAKATSAATGWVAFSYIADNIVVWDAGAELWHPHEMIEHIFRMDEEYHPVTIAIEKTGLDEYLFSPIHMEERRRGIVLPLFPLQAPRGKLKFIEGLQPRFHAGKISFAQELPILRSQLLSYPSGRIDAPNALAYALHLYPGDIVYPGFSDVHIAETIAARRDTECFLAVNASATITTAALVQVIDEGIAVFADYVREGPPGVELAGIVADARIRARQLAPSAADLVAYAPRSHFVDHDTIGLRGAARAVPVELLQGTELTVGRDQIRRLLKTTSSRGVALLRVLFGLRWTTNGFRSGYHYPVLKGRTSNEPRANEYRILMEGLESVCGLLRGGAPLATTGKRYAYTEDGRKYQTLLPSGREDVPLKSDPLRPDSNEGPRSALPRSHPLYR
jgi:hypothetical protein